MKKLSLLFLFLLSFSMLWSAPPLKFEGKKAVKNAKSQIMFNQKQGLIGKIDHCGVNLVKSVSLIFEKGGKIVNVTVPDGAKTSFDGKILTMTNDFTHEKAKMHLETKIAIAGNGIFADYTFKGTKGYKLKGVNLLLNVETYEGERYSLGAKPKSYLTREDAKSNWNIFEQPKPVTTFLASLTEGIDLGFTFKGTSGKIGIVLPTGNKWYADYVLQVTVDKPNKLTFYLEMPAGGTPKAVSGKAQNTKKKNAHNKPKLGSIAPLKFQGQSIKNKRSLIRLKDIGVVGDILHCGEYLSKGMLLNFTKDGKNINIPLAITNNRTIEGKTMTVKNNFKHLGDSFDITTKLTLKNNGVLVEYDAQTSSEYKLEAVTFLMDYQTFVGDNCRIGNRKVYYKKKEEVDKPWNTLVFNQPAETFTASNKVGKDLEISFNGMKGKMNLSLPKTGFFKDYILRVKPDEQNNKIALLLNFPLGGEIKLPEGVVEGKNQVVNGGFETGVNNWGISLDPFDEDSKIILDESDKTEGNNALLLDIKQVKTPVAKDNQKVTVTSEYIKLGGSIDMTYSLDMKSNVEGVPVILKVLYFQTDGVANKGAIALEKRIKLTKDWKRYQHKVQLPKSMKDAFSVGVEIKKVAPNTKIWMDAVQLTPGSKALYSATKPVEVGGDTPDKFNLYEPKQNVPLEVRLKNNTATQKNVSLQLKVLDPDYYEVLNKVKKVSLKANQLDKSPLGDVVFNSEKQGAYRVYLTVLEKGKEIERYSYSFGIMQQMKNRTVNSASKFGLHMNGNAYLKALDLASRAGFTWLRGGSFSNMWALMAPTEHKFNQWVIKNNLKKLDIMNGYGLTPIPILGVATPKWATSAPKGSSEWRLYPPKPSYLPHFKDYISKMTNLYKGKVFAYEIWNEPNGSPFYRGTAKEFAPLLQTSYETIKSIDKEAKVMAFGLTHYDKSASNFMKGVFDEIGSDYCDGVSFHPYTKGRLDPDATHLDQQFKWIRGDIKKFGKDKDLWTTEFGFFTPQKFSKEFTPFKNQSVPKRLISEEECARFYVRHISTSFANGTEKAFYFIFQEGDIANRWFHGFVGVNGTRLKSAYFASAACIRNLDYTDCLGLTKVYKDISVTRFKKENAFVTVAWKTKGGKDIKIKRTKPLECEDINGNPFTLDPVNGEVYLTIGEDPIYLKGDIKAADIKPAGFDLGKYALEANMGSTLSFAVNGTLPSDLQAEVYSGAVVPSQKKAFKGAVTAEVRQQLIIEESYKVHTLLYSSKGKLVGRMERMLNVSDTAVK